MENLQRLSRKGVGNKRLISEKVCSLIKDEEIVYSHVKAWAFFIRVIEVAFYNKYTGFFENEYNAWKWAIKYIEANEPDEDYEFVLNTGDISQNANRKISAIIK